MEKEEIRPLKTLEDVLAWTPDPALKFRTEERTPRLQEGENSPKLLVCHDMQGGYLEDRFIGGSTKSDSYRFFHWNVVDTFVYFSHHFVTIPPIGWINSAHKHGVKVLGTFITEWDEGHEICQNLFGSPARIASIVQVLCSITKHFGFDGWLINIENKLEESLVPNVTNFLKLLKETLHDSIPGSEIIWYDSVLHSGELKWQNELNDSNSSFFEASDGIFLNYNWKDDHLKRSVSNSGTRKTDVYVGVDVFGRGCLGGGGYNTSEALEAICKFGLSVALFAPGWVLETQGSENFTENQHKFWSLINQYFKSTKFCQLPLRTSFCQGFGQNLYKLGKIVRGGSWFNLSSQELQPIFDSCCDETSEGCQSVIFCEDAFNGGGCLKLSGRLRPLVQEETMRFFNTHSEISTLVMVSLTWKTLKDAGVEMSLLLSFSNAQGEEHTCMLLCGEESGPDPTGVKLSKGSVTLLHPASPKEMETHGLHSPETHGQWISRFFLLNESSFQHNLLREVKIRFSRCTNVEPEKNLEFAFLFGQMQIEAIAGNVQTKLKEENTPC